MDVTWLYKPRVWFWSEWRHFDKVTSSYRPGCEVIRLEAPLFTVVFIIQHVVFHDVVFGLKQEVAVRTGHGSAAVVH